MLYFNGIKFLVQHCDLESHFGLVLYRTCLNLSKHHRQTLCLGAEEALKRQLTKWESRGGNGIGLLSCAPKR